MIVNDVHIITVYTTRVSIVFSFQGTVWSWAGLGRFQDRYIIYTSDLSIPQIEACLEWAPNVLIHTGYELSGIVNRHWILNTHQVTNQLRAWHVYAESEFPTVCYECRLGNSLTSHTIIRFLRKIRKLFYEAASFLQDSQRLLQRHRKSFMCIYLYFFKTKMNFLALYFGFPVLCFSLLKLLLCVMFVTQSQHSSRNCFWNTVSFLKTCHSIQTTPTT